MLHNINHLISDLVSLFWLADSILDSVFKNDDISVENSDFISATAMTLFLLQKSQKDLLQVLEFNSF